MGPGGRAGELAQAAPPVVGGLRRIFSETKISGLLRSYSVHRPLPLSALNSAFPILETGTHHPYDVDLIDRAARALFPGAPNSLLARSCRVLVAKGDSEGLAQIRAAESCEICRDLDNAIARRDVEFMPRRGFMEIRVREPGGVPREGRNRRGRPKIT
jgi:hypothetical protein